MEQHLTIVQMNDSHAYLDLHPELFWEKGRSVYRMAGGYARIATLLKQIRSENPGRVMFVDGGDTFHGTYPVIQAKGKSMLPIMNALALDGMTAHWEFAYTPDGFEQLTRSLNYPVLAMNVYKKDSQELLFKPYVIVEVGGLRIGLAGIASNIVDKTMPPQFSEGVYFTNGREELPGVVDILRNQEKADLVVMVSHLGFPQDIQLLEDVPGVDIDLSAHTHHRLETAVKQGGALVTQAGSHGSFLTRLDLTIENGKITDYKHRLIEVSEEIHPDPEVAEMVLQANAPYKDAMDEIVGETKVPLDRGRNLETTMDHLLLDALLDETGAQVAFSNGWRYGAPLLPGPIRMGDLSNIAPMDPPITTVELRGSEIKQLLEENLEHTFSREPFKQMGGYLKRIGGMRAYFKIENPPMQRIHKLFIGEEEILADRYYQAVYITEQGVAGKFGRNRQTQPQKTMDVLKKYVKQQGPLEIQLRDSFIAI